jgi:hypothetical protein
MTIKTTRVVSVLTLVLVAGVVAGCGGGKTAAKAEHAAAAPAQPTPKNGQQCVLLDVNDGLSLTDAASDCARPGRSEWNDQVAGAIGRWCVIEGAEQGYDAGNVYQTCVSEGETVVGGEHYSTYTEAAAQVYSYILQNGTSGLGGG